MQTSTGSWLRLALLLKLLQTFGNLIDSPITVDLTIEEGQRLKVVYGSKRGFHGIDLDTSKVFDIYIPHVSILLRWNM